ncbi:hypothetical protein ROT00_08115 [Agromyces mediolanus]|uniref:hypothetical protein n=1 Tax=Agromyces mediolanus TaxID=41986 RepID=UPI003835BB5C
MPMPPRAIVPLRAALLAMLLVVGTCLALLFGHTLDSAHAAPAGPGPSAAVSANAVAVPGAVGALEASAPSIGVPGEPGDGGEGLLALCLGVGCAIVLLFVGLRLGAAPRVRSWRVARAVRRRPMRALVASTASVSLDALGISRT